MTGDYAEFITAKTQAGADDGFDAARLPAQMFDYQRALTEWACNKGRAAIFADCGLGKTLMQLAWADNAARHHDGRVLILTPLAVGAQTIQEAERWGIEAHRSRSGELPGRIIVSNYERVGQFDPGDFCAVVCDESSILKNFDGKRRQELTGFMRKVPHRLLATATAAPNDYIELGTSSEALGYMGHIDMLGRFFVNDQNNVATKRMYGEAAKWRFRGHSEPMFWRWVASWARACKKPSDLGFDDGPLVLPQLIERRTMVESATAAPGMLFVMPAATLADQRAEKRRTVEERCARVADIHNEHGEPAIAWCQLNEESAQLADMIDGSVEVSGKDSDDAKEEKLLAFLRGDARVLVTKPSIGAWGLNFQHCRRVSYFPSHSYEQYYQAIRRCWRFGQRRDVIVDVVMTEGERRIMDNMERKSAQAMRMFESLVAAMNSAASIKIVDRHKNNTEIPSWL
jgi:hypothetical protein